MKNLTDENVMRAAAALYQVLGAYDAPEGVLDIALALAQDEVLPSDPMDLLPFPAEDQPYIVINGTSYAVAPEVADLCDHMRAEIASLGGKL